MNKLEIKNLYKSFDGNQVLKDISFQVADGEFVAVMGQSGCGKSTLLYCVSGMDSPTSGEIFFDGQKTSGLSEKKMENLRLKRMGFIFQKANFLKNMSVADNIVFPAFQLGERNRDEIQKTVKELIERLGILSVAGHDIRQVSGGQLQRAAICRAMINRPDILFGDEPTGSLDKKNRDIVMNLLHELNEEGKTVIIVTHDQSIIENEPYVVKI